MIYFFRIHTDENRFIYTSLGQPIIRSSWLVLFATTSIRKKEWTTFIVKLHGSFCKEFRQQLHRICGVLCSWSELVKKKLSYLYFWYRFVMFNLFFSECISGSQRHPTIIEMLINTNHYCGCQDKFFNQSENYNQY